MMRHSPEQHHVACGSTVSEMFEDYARRLQAHWLYDAPMTR